MPDHAPRFREAGPRFLLTVDAEEEFDWSAPLQRDAYRLDGLPQLGRFQRFCEEHGVRPVYLADYPVVTAPLTAHMLGDALAAGRADIGLQLHPWVNPPHDEALSVANSFAGNLPFALERAKLLALQAAVRHHFGRPAIIYRAGRYGVGENTARILLEAGIAIDTSVRAHFDYSGMGGPNFAQLGPHPWWVGRPGTLLELPLTTMFTGLLHRRAARIYPGLAHRRYTRAALARLGWVNRIPLTPEGVTVAEGCRAIDAALAQGVPVLTLSFHGSSLIEGGTPYARSQADIEQLYTWWRRIFAHLAARGVRCALPQEILASLELA